MRARFNRRSVAVIHARRTVCAHVVDAFYLFFFHRSLVIRVVIRVARWNMFCSFDVKPSMAIDVTVRLSRIMACARASAHFSSSHASTTTATRRGTDAREERAMTRGADARDAREAREARSRGVVFQSFMRR